MALFTETVEDVDLTVVRAFWKQTEHGPFSLYSLTPVSDAHEVSQEGEAVRPNQG